MSRVARVALFSALALPAVAWASASLSTGGCCLGLGSLFGCG